MTANQHRFQVERYNEPQVKAFREALEGPVPKKELVGRLASGFFGMTAPTVGGIGLGLGALMLTVGVDPLGLALVASPLALWGMSALSLKISRQFSPLTKELIASNEEERILATEALNGWLSETYGLRCEVSLGEATLRGWEGGRIDLRDQHGASVQAQLRRVSEGVYELQRQEANGPDGSLYFDRLDQPTLSANRSPALELTAARSRSLTERA